MTVIRSIGNDHGHLGHIARVGAWCWTETGRAGKASLQYFWRPFLSMIILFSVSVSKFDFELRTFYFPLFTDVFQS